MISAKAKQTGMATLLISVVLLTSIGLMSVYSAQVGVMEQKISANHYRTSQAFESAQAGMDNMVQSLDAQIIYSVTQLNTSVTQAFADAGRDLANLSSADDGQSLGHYDLALAVNASNSNLIDVTLSGYAGDNADGAPNQVIRQRLLHTPMLNAAPAAPLIAKGIIDIDGDVSLTNKEKESLISSWSGGATTVGSATIDVTSTDGTTDGGYSQNQANLAGLSGDDLFENTFSDSKVKVRNRSAVINCIPGDSGRAAVTCDQDVLSTAVDVHGNPKGSNIIWIDAKKVNSDPDLDPTYDKLTIGGSGFKLGTAGHPVILVVDGELEISGDAEFYGVIYTTKDFDNASYAAQVNGSLISEGNIVASGALNVTYDNSVFTNMNTMIARYIRVAGSWRDF